MAAVYADLDALTARIPWHMGNVGAATSPSTSQVQAWLDNGEYMLNAALTAAGLPAPYVDTAAVGQLAEALLDYAEGRVRRAFASGGGDGSNLDGREELGRFYKTLKEIRESPSEWAVRLGGSAPESARRVGAYIVDNDEGLTLEAGDFDPIFELDDRETLG